MIEKSTAIEICNQAREYLLSFDRIDEKMLDKHLKIPKPPQSVPGLLYGMLRSISNRRGMSNTIGDIENLRSYLEDFVPMQIVKKYGKKYGNNWKGIFKRIKENYKHPGEMKIDNPKSYWVIFCKSIVSAAHFLSQFSSVEEFKKFVSPFERNEYTRVALPLLLAEEVFGLGFVLACDFLKENGYPKFVKPDVHIKAIFHGIGISKSKSPYDIFKDVIRFSKQINKLPYYTDKLFWLVGSGNFYLDGIQVPTKRKDFIDEIKHDFRDRL
jgi:hypothetical protein